MEIAVTGAAGYLGQLLLPELCRYHRVRASDLRGTSADPMIEIADVRIEADMQRLFEGVEVVIHLAAAQQDDSLSKVKNEEHLLDTRLKGTYTLLGAALQAGVKRVVQISDLCVFSGYDVNVTVSEDFLPLPNTSAAQQAIYLSELIGREFARQQPGLVLTLRLGQVIKTSSLCPNAVFSDNWLDADDAVAAILRSLEIQAYDGFNHWGLYNLAADVPGGRYSLLKIQSGHFAFFPKQDFSLWRH